MRPWEMQPFDVFLRKPRNMHEAATRRRVIVNATSLVHGTQVHVRLTRPFGLPKLNCPCGYAIQTWKNTFFNLYRVFHHVFLIQSLVRARGTAHHSRRLFTPFRGRRWWHRQRPKVLKKQNGEASTPPERPPKTDEFHGRGLRLGGFGWLLCKSMSLRNGQSLNPPAHEKHVRGAESLIEASIPSQRNPLADQNRSVVTLFPLSPVSCPASCLCHCPRFPLLLPESDSS